jgi:DNA replication protein
MEQDILKEWIDSGNTTLPTILLTHYKDIGLSNDDLVVILQLKSFIDRGEGFPDTDILAKRMHVTKEQAFQSIHQLINKKVLSIDTHTNDEGKSQDIFSFDLLWEKLVIFLKQRKMESTELEEAVQAKDLYRLFEAEFGRPLSPMEIQTLNMWIDEDQYAPELIQMALREAVLSQVYSLKYMDKILLNWEKKNIRTKEQVEKEAKRHRDNQQTMNQQTQNSQPIKPVPMHNWLKGLKQED